MKYKNIKFKLKTTNKQKNKKFYQKIFVSKIVLKFSN